MTLILYILGLTFIANPLSISPQFRDVKPNTDRGTVLLSEVPSL